ncbi:chloride channel protein [Streptomyces sp. NBC_00102]|uniref:chloride channel protein n=1 Tax=Streptomyces sp. NBC_00102 TaxID=2975652 RepID=UPI00225992A6|nr:chloride channel protein [Streptomyces sp. NBC_00102]MCX5400545.1 chloride channel protein [Streptomyces sp. NBC_00102]
MATVRHGMAAAALDRLRARVPRGGGAPGGGRAASEESPEPTLRWLALAALIGVVAGLGAVALYELVHLGNVWILDKVGGYHVHTTTSDGAFRVSEASPHPWAVPLVAAGGALLASLLVLLFAREAGGHGTDAAIHAALHDPYGMRGRVPLVKLVASGLTIGSGGSGGTEGPAAQISASFGSVIARRLGLSPRDARTALVVGLAAGVGAVFRAPIGGALLCAEILYRRDADFSVLPKALVASAVSWVCFGSLLGFGPIFGVHGTALEGGTPGLLLIVVVGLAAGAAGRAFAWCFYAVHTRVERRGRSAAARLLLPATGGLVVGVIGLGVPGVLGTGYGLMEGLMHRQVLLGMSLWLVLLVPVAKLVATSLSVGSGGSGGIFGPSLFIGAGVGAAVWRLFEPIGIVPHDPTAYVVIGMAACLGPVARAPLAVLVMAVETVGDAALLGPGLIGVLCARIVVGGTTLYRSQLDRAPGAEGPDRAAPEAEQPRAEVPADTPAERPVDPIPHPGGPCEAVDDAEPGATVATPGSTST